MKFWKKSRILIFFVLIVVLCASSALAKGNINIVKIDAQTQSSTEGSSRSVKIQVDTENVDSAVLEYSVDDETYSTKSTSIEKDVISFSVDSSVPGDYQVSSLQAELNGETLTLPIKDISFTITPSKALLDEMDSIKPIEKSSSKLRLAANGKKVVVLDAGHCSTHAGASREGLREEVITLKIAQAAYNELKTYPNVDVYMTRNSASCPAGGGSTSTCLNYRTNFSRNKSADLFVSFHINSTGAVSQTSVTGAYVYITDYSRFAKTSRILTNKVLAELKSRVGLASKGAWVNNDDHNNGKYDDGVWKDDLAVIRNNVLNGIEPALIEHAFVNNPNDRVILSNDSKVKQMGVADAVAIADYLGLSKSSGGWNIQGITSDISGKKATFKPNASGNTSGFQYKFVYNKYNNATGSYDWKVWDVISGMSANNANGVTWTAPSPGKYEITMDVKDRNGKTYSYKSVVSMEDWNITGVSATQNGSNVTIKPNASGAASSFKYKFVYNKYNQATGSYDWADYAVIAPMSTGNANGVTWTAPSAGKYEIYMDVEDNNGKLRTYTTKITVTSSSSGEDDKPGTGQLTGVSLSSSSANIGDVIVIKPQITGASGVKFKYSYSYNGASTGILKPSTTDTAASIKIKYAGTCKLFIDAIYSDGSVISKSASVSIDQGNLVYSGVNVPKTAKVGDVIRIEPIASGTAGAKFKYVYSYNNWNPWGVLKHFSTDQAASIKLKYPGTCEIIIDVMDKDGKTTTKSSTIKVTK